MTDLVQQPNIWTHQGFLLAEDKMVKDHCSNITVPGRDSTDPGIKVGCWFRWPEGERQIRYPFIVIDLISAEPNYPLFTSQYYLPEKDLYRPSFAPDVPTPPDGWGTMGYSVRNFLPMILTYQVAVHTRSALHDRYLQSIFQTDIFPPRPFWMWCATDETWRRTELVQRVASDLAETTESGTKRIFRKVYTLTVLAEIPQDRLAETLVYKALRVLIPVVDLAMFDAYYENVLKGQADPMHTFSEQERVDQGEFLYTAHGGAEVPPAV